MTATAASAVQRECTADEGSQWKERYTTGYQHGRSDMLNGSVRERVLLSPPAEVPGETGAQYVARHADLAYRIGYTRACQWYASQAA